MSVAPANPMPGVLDDEIWKDVLRVAAMQRREPVGLLIEAWRAYVDTIRDAATYRTSGLLGTRAADVLDYIDEVAMKVAPCWRQLRDLEDDYLDEIAREWWERDGRAELALIRAVAAGRARWAPG